MVDKLDSSRRPGSTTHARYWGIPIWSVFLIMIAASLTGALLCSLGSGVQGKRYFLCLALAGVISTSVVKVRGLLLTICLQPILFLILSPPAAMLSAKLVGTSINLHSRTALLSYVFPLTNAFPFLAGAVALSLIIALTRVALFVRKEKANPSVFAEGSESSASSSQAAGASASTAHAAGASAGVPTQSSSVARPAAASTRRSTLGAGAGSVQPAAATLPDSAQTAPSRTSAIGAARGTQSSVATGTPQAAGRATGAAARTPQASDTRTAGVATTNTSAAAASAQAHRSAGAGTGAHRPSATAVGAAVAAGATAASGAKGPVQAPRRDPNERGVVPGTLHGAAAAAGRVGSTDQTNTPRARPAVREGGARRADRRLGEPGARSVSDLQRAAARSNSQGTIGRTGGIVPESRRQRPGYTPGDAASRHEAGDLRTSGTPSARHIAPTTGTAADNYSHRGRFIPSATTNRPSSLASTRTTSATPPVDVSRGSSTTSSASSSSTSGPALHRTSLSDLGKESQRSNAGSGSDRVAPSWTRSPIPQSRHTAAGSDDAPQASGHHRAAGNAEAPRAKEFIQPLGGAIEEHSPLPRHRHSAEPRD